MTSLILIRCSGFVEPAPEQKSSFPAGSDGIMGQLRNKKGKPVTDRSWFMTKEIKRNTLRIFLNVTVSIQNLCHGVRMKLIFVTVEDLMREHNERILKHSLLIYCNTLRADH